MAQGKELIKLALFGQPVKSSLSPAIHRMFAGQIGLDIDYQLIEPNDGDFPQALEAFRQSGGVGCNVTLPFKQDAWQLAAGSSAEVKQAQAANTLVCQSSGWFAHTTDGSGLVADLTVNHGLDISGRRVLILGAGGAASGVLGRLLAEGPQQVVLVNRNLTRARSLSERFDSSGKVSVTSWSELSGQGAFNLVINATSLGHKGEAPPLNTSSFAEGGLCYDMNYFKASQPLKRHCEDIHQPYIDGLGMLVEQAAKSFNIWTSETPETLAVIEACRRDAG
ncbi:MAG: shikimate dehydrogenase [Xanthomonadales bacterium]|nr:shikimate dehydrogenase [Xanthomonadales bacterium]